LHFPSDDRRDWTAQQRVDEIVRWSKIVASPEGLSRIHREILADLGDRLLRDSPHTDAGRAQAELQRTELASLRTELERQRASFNTELEMERAARRTVESDLDAGRAPAEQRRTELASIRAELEKERAVRSTAESNLDEIRASTSWRMTRPLRAAVDRFRRLKSRPGA
jgi:hypothetical protein